MLELRIMDGAKAMPLFDLPALLGRKHAAKEIGDQIEALIAFVDALGGDPDIEDDDPAGGNITDEPHDTDGDEEDHNGSEDDCVVHAFSGPGCPIADPGGTDVNGGCSQREEDEEDDGAALRGTHVDRIRRTRCREVRLGRHLIRYRLTSPLRAAQGSAA